jgi:hypothetical protein
MDHYALLGLIWEFCHQVITKARILFGKTHSVKSIYAMTLFMQPQKLWAIVMWVVVQVELEQRFVLCL